MQVKEEAKQGGIKVESISAAGLNQLSELMSGDKKAPIVIPLIKNNWRIAPSSSSSSSDDGLFDPNDAKDAVLRASRDGPPKKRGKESKEKDEDGDVPMEEKSIEELAAAELLKSARQDTSSKSDESDSLAASVPLLMQNMVPGLQAIKNEDERFRHDMKMRAADVTSDAYDRVSVEDFGVGMLLGMGWRPGQGVGKHNVVVEPVEFLARGHRMGLGATMAKPSDKKQKKYIKPGESRDAKEMMRVAPDADGRVHHFRKLSQRIIPVHSLQLKPRALVEIMGGVHSGLYGRVQSIKGDKDAPDAICSVVLNINEEVVDIPRFELEILDEHALPSDHPALGKSKSSKSSSSLSSSSSSSSSSSRSKRSRSSRSPSREREKDKKRREDKDRDRKKVRDSKSSRKEKEREKERPLAWVVPSIRVRIISTSLLGGKYYQKKARVEDVVSISKFTLVAEDGKVIEDVREKDVETALPKPGGRVRILRGSSVKKEHQGQSGKLLERSSSAAKAAVQLDNMEIVTLSFDDVAELV